MILLQKALVAGVLCCALAMATSGGVAKNSELGEVCHAYALNSNGSSPYVRFPLEKNFSVRFYTTNNGISDVRLVLSSGAAKPRNLTIKDNDIEHKGTRCPCSNEKELRLKYGMGNLTVSSSSGERLCNFPGLQLGEDAKLKIENFGHSNHTVVFGCSDADCITYPSELMTSYPKELRQVWASAKSKSSSALLEFCWRNRSTWCKCAGEHREEHQLTFECNQGVLLKVSKKENGDFALMRGGSLFLERNNTEEEINYTVLDFKVKISTDVTWGIGNCTETQNPHQKEKLKKKKKKKKMEEKEREKARTGSTLDYNIFILLSGWMAFAVIVLLVLSLLVPTKIRTRLAYNMMGNKKRRTGSRMGENLLEPVESDVPNSLHPTNDLASPGPQTPVPRFPPVQKETKEEKEDEEEGDHTYDYFDETKLQQVLRRAHTSGPPGDQVAPSRSVPQSLGSRDSVNSVYDYTRQLEAKEEVLPGGGEKGGGPLTLKGASQIRGAKETRT